MGRGACPKHPASRTLKWQPASPVPPQRHNTAKQGRLSAVHCTQTTAQLSHPSTPLSGPSDAALSAAMMSAYLAGFCGQGSKVGEAGKRWRRPTDEE